MTVQDLVGREIVLVMHKGKTELEGTVTNARQGKFRSIGNLDVDFVANRPNGQGLEVSFPSRGIKSIDDAHGFMPVVTLG